MKKKKTVKVGIGFVTGRKSFKNVAQTYIEGWNTALNKEISLNLFVSYDLKYSNTRASDYKISDEGLLDIVDSAHYLSSTSIDTEAQSLVVKGVITQAEAKLIFGEGYAMKRNATLYYALKNNMDYLIFLDDDEYPMAVFKTEIGIAWKGQEIISTHIQNIQHADMTHGYHCGYVSPIPNLRFNESLAEEDFHLFIEAISNDIINWESVKQKMDDGGATYASLATINEQMVEYVEEIGGMKFISGANLGFNLSNIDKVFPFYNPPGARGEDTFLSTAICECKIRKIHCYTFHDGFGEYENLLHGVLPTQLKTMRPDKSAVTNRFLKATIGWIRYKPLLIYITDKNNFEARIAQIRENLKLVLPKICAYFENDRFMEIMEELELYQGNVKRHYRDFQKTKAAWIKVVKYLKNGI
ncbi:MAG: hypothetical protein LBS74_04460 [Oscillospiraceae bacterium]|nr:hypothetical protein [Oscillospiraceae bacterium]